MISEARAAQAASAHTSNKGGSGPREPRGGIARHGDSEEGTEGLGAAGLRGLGLRAGRGAAEGTSGGPRKRPRLPRALPGRVRRGGAGREAAAAASAFLLALVWRRGRRLLSALARRVTF